MKKSFMENLFKEKSFLEKSKVENWLQKFYYREISLHEKFGYMRNFVTWEISLHEKFQYIDPNRENREF